MHCIKRAWRKIVLIYGVFDAIRFLDRQCMSIKLSNDVGNFIGHWNCEGNFLQTVTEARQRIGKQSTTIKQCQSK